MVIGLILGVVGTVGAVWGGLWWAARSARGAAPAKSE